MVRRSRSDGGGLSTRFGGGLTHFVDGHGRSAEAASCDSQWKTGGVTAKPTTLERAFELARTGKFHSVEEIRKRLLKEHHDQVDSHLSGPMIRRQLRRACTDARAAAPAQIIVEPVQG
jgi:hypothetical protein